MGQPGTKPLRQKVTPSRTQRLVHMPVDLAARAQPDATPASDCAPPAGKLVLHTRALSQLESPAGLRVAHASPADSIASIARKAVRFDRCAPRFAGVRRPASS